MRPGKKFQSVYSQGMKWNEKPSKSATHRVKEGCFLSFMPTWARTYFLKSLICNDLL